jgi:peptidoglycan hydrolase-like protein with peptidoglycan-binding domain
MRELRLQPAFMSGPDVSDWQSLLKSQDLLQTIDGQFGPKSDTATRAYQTKCNLASNGVVTSEVISRAVSDGYQCTTGTNLWGLDANVDCSSFAGRLPAAGVQYVARYYSHNAQKTLTLSEAQELSAAGLFIVTVFEDSNNATEFFSTDIGADHAAQALQLAAVIGQPPRTAIYFAVDFDPDPTDVEGAISDYFRAINNAFAAVPAQYVVGVYGSGLTCRVLRDSGLASLTWLTGSTGFREYAAFRPQADLVQLAPERALFAGLSIDDDIAQRSEYGAFRIPAVQTATTGT